MTNPAESVVNSSLEQMVEEEYLERTLAIVKPDAIHRYDEVMSIIEKEGLAILRKRKVCLTAEDAAGFYQDNYFEENFSGNVTNLSSGASMALALCGPKAITHWADLVGPAKYEDRVAQPKCLRNRFGTPNNDCKNGVHASANELDALRELHFFFPDLIVEPVVTDKLACHYLNQNVHPVLTIALSKLIQAQPSDPVLWLADWLIANNPNKPKESASGQVCS